MTSGWRVELLGRLRAVRDETTLTRFRTQKTASLFAYLAFHAGVAQSREELIARFWPESDLDQGRMSLRTALSALRKDLGDALVADTNRVTLWVTSDYQEVLEALRQLRRTGLSDRERRDALHRVVDSYGGPLLPGFYDDWVLAERDRLAESYLVALQRLTRLYDESNDPAAALEYAHLAAAAAPLSEPARATLIRLLCQAQRAPEALRQYQDLERLLDEQLGVAPGPETAALVAGIAAPEATGTPLIPVLLPVPLGRFRGRREEFATLVQRLSGGKGDGEGTRLFTLFGPGGIGKTRLAIEVGKRVAAHHRFAAVYFVSLAAARDLPGLWSGIHAGLRLPQIPDLALAQQIEAHLSAAGPTLLLCDNLEQALPDAGLLMETLLQRVPDLVILTTSRQRLAVAGEALVAVGALGPDDAVALFVDRARAVDPQFRLTESNTAAVRALTETLEGFPLGIELAAAWSGVCTPQEIDRQLRENYHSLPEVTRREPRHASVRAAIAWSADLLEPALRAALFPLSVFHGGWDAPAALAIAGVGLQGLASLRDRALVTSEVCGASLRFHLHESVRAFGAAALEPAARAALAARHATYYLSRCEAAQLERPRDDAWARDLSGLVVEEANLRAARQHATAEQKARFALALTPLWLHQGRFQEGEAACEEAIGTGQDVLSLRLARASLAYGHNNNALAEEDLRAVVDSGCGLLRTRALLLLAQLALFNREDSAAATGWLDRIQERTPALAAKERCLRGSVHHYRGEGEAANTVLAQAALDARAAGELVLAAHALNNRGNALHQRGDLEGAAVCYQEALELRERLGLRVEVLRTRIGLANLAAARGDLSGALQRYQRAEREAAAMGDRHVQALVLGNQAAVLQDLGRTAESLPLALESLKRKSALDLKGGVATSLNNIADSLCLLGGHESAAVLHGAAAALRKRAGMVLGPAFQAQLAQVQERARLVLGDEHFARAFQEGEDLPEAALLTVVERAIATTTEPGPVRLV